jgi:hypothetical protein
MSSTIRDATVAEVREYFRGRGDTVRISRDGEVTFRRYDKPPVLWGGRLGEYKVDDFDGTIYLP